MDLIQSKIHIVFNKFFYDFVKDVSETCPAVKSQLNIKVKSPTSTKFAKFFFERVTEDVLNTFKNSPTADLLCQDAVLDMEVSKGVSLRSIVKELGKEQYSAVASYLYIFVLLKLLDDATIVSPEAKSEGDVDAISEDDINDAISSASILFDRVMECIKVIQRKEDDYKTVSSDILDDNILAIMENLNNVMALETDLSGDDMANESFMDPSSILQGTQIGSLAQEISKEINIKDLNINSPEDILKTTNSDALGNIISKVGSKMQEKIDKGEIKHDALLKEAFGMFNMFNGSGMMQNPMFQNLFKNKNVKVNESKLKEMSTRERLRKKYESKNAPL